MDVLTDWDDRALRNFFLTSLQTFIFLFCLRTKVFFLQKHSKSQKRSAFGVKWSVRQKKKTLARIVVQ
jgi:hypothetical protein